MSFQSPRTIANQEYDRQRKLILFTSRMELIRAHVWISGRVQGVGYRMSAAKIAMHLELKGWVRNLPDGRVEAVFEGAEAAIEAMLRWCREGPPEAIVEQVRASYETPEGLPSFTIRR